MDASLAQTDTPVVVAAPAPSQEDASQLRTDSPPRRELLSAELTGGVGTPLGWLGAGLAITPIHALSLHGGAGLGSYGIQVEAGARVRWRMGRRVWFAPGASWSHGAFVAVGEGPLPNMDAKYPPMRVYSRADFVNAEAALEVPIGTTWLRPFMGFGGVVDGKDGQLVNPCSEFARTCSNPSRNPTVFYFGITLAFGLL